MTPPFGRERPGAGVAPSRGFGSAEDNEAARFAGGRGVSWFLAGASHPPPSGDRASNLPPAPAPRSRTERARTPPTAHRSVADRSRRAGGRTPVTAAPLR